MSVVAEFVIPPAKVAGGKTLARLPEATIHLERIVPAGDAAVPFLWMVGADTEPFLHSLRTEPEIVSAAVLTELQNRTLFQVEWRPDGTIINAINRLNATILDAEGTAERWLFRVRARDREGLTTFQQLFAEEGIPVQVRRVHDLAVQSAGHRQLTPAQRETLLTAHECGYFDDPRRITQTELGDHFGISGRAISTRLRRGTKNLIAAELLGPDDWKPE